ncbi:MAG: TetR/AcrR family transcriptional regulator [Verrucomicrobia bacterium]|nr:TetR/AcrR family transcriptional regulator [Verrucomicrobiota bacterium]
MATPTTKERILDAAEEIMLTKSFHSVGLNEILRAVNVPKGSFYHHFESKEQFGVELLKHYMADASAYKRRILLSTETEANARQRLLTFLESNIARFLECNGKCPCLVVKLASEVADFSEPMRQVLADGHEEWARIAEAMIREGIANGNIHPDVDPKSASRLFGSLWMGAMQHAAIARNAEPLRDALDFIATKLLPEP